MSDTSIVKPLRWEDDNRTSSGYGVSIIYGVHGNGNHWRTTCDTARHPSMEAAKAACQSDHETRILSAIDLTAHDAAVRAEALEGVIVFLKDAASNVRKQLPGDTQQQADGWRYAANLLDALILDIHALKGEG